MDDTQSFTINGVTYEIDDSIGPDDRLVNYIHDLQLTGTHITCYEGACGACVVTAAIPDPVTGKKTSRAVNSCLVPVASCDGWDITTVEGIGNSKDGYHPIQEKLAEYSGTQCGYCSPGFVMSMYGLTQENPSWTESDVDKILDSNFCRCTGYRPIVEAFKSITPEEIKKAQEKGCKGNKTGCCKGRCGKATNFKPKSPKCKKSGPGVKATFYQPKTLEELYSIIAGLPEGDRYSLICGNTAQAVVGVDYSSKATIFIRNVKELAQVNQTDEALVIGATVSINRMIEEMRSAASKEGFAYLQELADAWESVASYSVRNLGSWAGNLVMKMYHKGFQSDLFPHLVAAGATVTLVTTDGTESTVDIEELMKSDIVTDRKIIRDLTLPKMEDNTVFKVFKVGQRFTNSHGYVNGGFRMVVDADNKHTITGKPVIVYTCINDTFVHASATEEALTDKSLEDESVLQAAFDALAKEVVPDESPVEPDPAYKVALTQNALYKVILGIIGDVASSDLTSGATDLERPKENSVQTYDENKDYWPLCQPIPKLEAYIQCSGEAEYAVLAPGRPDELFGLFVTSTQANARIVSIDATDALKIPGVVAFIGKEDITGINDIHVMSYTHIKEPLFAEERVGYFGQPLGLLVCEGRGHAYVAAAAVKVVYDDIKAPILSIDDAPKTPLNPRIIGDVDAGFDASTTTVEGTMYQDGQYHFALESQVCIATPTDEGYDIIAGTQWNAETQRAIGQVMGIKDNQVNVTTKRLGGAFGCKIDRCNFIAAAAALAAQKTRRSVRVSLDFNVNTTLIGWREPYKCVYKAGVDDNGILQAIEATITSDAGHLPVFTTVENVGSAMQSCYACPNWKVHPQIALTNTATSCAMRAPGKIEGIIFMETVMDHLATKLGVDPLEFRQKNLMPDGVYRPVCVNDYRLRSLMAGDPNPPTPPDVFIEKNLIKDMIDQIVETADVDKRKADIDTFNKNNKWKKRGLAVMPEMWPYGPPSVHFFNVLVSTNARDGSVSVSHGGSELGQGINTKVAQCAAYELGIPLDMIAVRPTNSYVNANSNITSGSWGSDTASHNVSIACRNLKERLETFRKTLKNPEIEWTQLIQEAFNAGVDICERYINVIGEIKGYGVFGVTASEIEVDVLTGQYMVRRVDILEDAGRSMSPLVDIGQVEGGFVMGQGLFTTEKPLYDPKTGERLTNTTWLYKPPYAFEIPADFRVTLLHDAPNPIGVQSSKVTGEPPVIMAFSIVMALREAISSARADAGTTGWFEMDTPLTVDAVQKLCLVDSKRLVINDA